MSVTSLLVILSILVFDGATTVAILAAATGAGLWAVRGLRLHDEPPVCQVVLAAGLGLGGLSLAMLALGSAGVLGRGIWWVLLAAMITAGLVRAIAITRRADPHGTNDPEDQVRRRTEYWTWLLAVPFAALSLAAAACPPGYLWPSEGNGYDVLEYHFAAPKEYLAAGRIEFLPHNLYASQPLNAEMLYLLAFVLRGGAAAGIYSAQLLNVGLAALTVAAAWLAGRQFGPRSGLLAALAVATCPFVTFLCGVAYAENGLMAATGLALACLLRAIHPRNATGRWTLACGLFAGLAAGFKYSALALGALPLALAIPTLVRPRRRAAAIFALGAAVTFAPWAARNRLQTGNPVFPLARPVFGEQAGVWCDEAAERWQRGHAPPPSERPPAARAAAAWTRIFANPMYGPFLFVLAGLGAVAAWRRDRRVVLLLLALAAWTALAWAAASHLVDRFALPIVAPLAVLCGAAATAVDGSPSRRGTLLFWITVVVATGWNLASARRPFTDALVFKVAAFGRDDLMRSGDWPGTSHVPRLNELLARGRRVLLLGEARTFYLDGRPAYFVAFNCNPLAEELERWRAGGDGDPVGWLTERGYEFLYVGWSELRRLERTYGVPEGLARLNADDLLRAGLECIEDYFAGAGRYASLFRLSSPRSNRISSP